MTPNLTYTGPASTAISPARQPPAIVRAMPTSVLSRRAGLAGKCSDRADDARWYPDTGNKRWQTVAPLARGRCCGCPVTAECLELALRFESRQADSWGIWGGTVPHERRMLIRQRQEAAAASLAARHA
jgi:Transcription factor WhiB